MSKLGKFAAACAAVLCAFGAMAGTDYYVRTTGDDTNDGTTPETARATLAAGMTLLTETGDRLLVGPGVYTNSTAFTVNNGRSVIGEEGAEKTQIRVSTAYTLFTMNATGGAGEVRGFTIAPCAGRVDCKMFNNSAGLFADCVVSNLNVSGAAGLMGSSSAIVSNCVFYGLGSSGRDAVLEQWTDGRIYNCTFIRCNGDNSAYGGTVMVYNGTVRNCLFVDCTNSCAAGGICLYGANGTAENCTVIRCVSKTDTLGGGISGAGKAKNCLVYGCSNKLGPANISGATCSNTASMPKPDGQGNLLAFSPNFADPSANDWRILSGNTVDAAVTLGWMTESAKDLAGNPRIVGAAPDIGCYEAVPYALACSAVPSESAYIGEQDVTLTAYVGGTDLTDLRYSWTVRNSKGEIAATATDLEEPTYTHSFGAGQYTVSLVVRNGAGETASWTSADTFGIVSDTIYVSANSTPVYPYDSWETAANDVMTAVKAIGNGCKEIIIDDGIYPISETIPLASAVTIRSRNGRDKTTVLVKGSKALVLSHAQARVTGISFLRDDSGRSGQICAFTSGLIDNCNFSHFSSNPTVDVKGTVSFSNCVFSTCGSSGRSSFFENGTLVNLDWCTFVDNVFHHDSEYGGLSDGFCSARFRNCLICNNRYTSNAPSTTYGFVTRMSSSNDLLENCTIVSNRCTNGTKGRVAITHTAGTIRNCIIAFNENENGHADLSTTVPANITHTLVTTTNVIDACEGCFVADPKFKHPSRGDYRLKGNSPAIDKALWQSWMENAKDLNGGPRLLNRAVDLGCYECPLTGLTLLVR